MLAVLAALAIAQIQTVSFTCRAEPMPELAQDLGKAIGRKLTVAKECENDVMLVSAQSVSADKLVDEIARVDAAQWTKKPDGRQLVPDRAARAKQQADMSQKRSAALHRQIANARTQIAARIVRLAKGIPEKHIPPSPPPYGWTRDLALLDLLDGLDLANLPWDPKYAVTYSTMPNRMQQALGPDGDVLVARIVSAYNADLSARAPQGQNDPDAQRRSISGYYKADLNIRYGGLDWIPALEFRLFDRNGKMLMEEAYQGLPDGDTGEPGARITDDPPIQFSPASLALTQIRHTLAAGSCVDATFPEVLRPYLAGSLRRDPLSLVPSDRLLALASAKGKPLVALVPDEAFPFLQTEAYEPGGVNSLDASLHQEGFPMREAEREGWIEITPTNPVADRLFRLDRSALRDLLTAAADHGVPNIDDLAAFAAKVRDTANTGVWSYAAVFVPELRAIAQSRMNWLALKVWGSLDSVQRQALMNAAAIPLSALASDLDDALADLVYGHDETAGIAQADGSQADDFYSEATEAMPNGIPRTATITAERRLAPVLAVGQFSPACPTPHIALAVSEIAGLVARYEAGLPGTDPNRMSNFQDMRVGNCATLLFTFHMGGRISFAAQIYDARFTGDGAKTSLASLPDDLSAAFQAALEKTLAHLKAANAVAVAAGTAAAPPP